MAGTVRSYEDLDAWKFGMRACECVYRATATFPPDERFGLVSQLRRAAVAVPSNIAEGYGRGSTQEYLRFLRIARGSLYEVETQLAIATRLDLANGAVCDDSLDATNECGRILAGLIKSIENKLKTQPARS